MLHQAHLIPLLLALAEPAAPAVAPGPAAGPVENRVAPSTFVRVNDKTYSRKVLAPHKGKLVVVNFWGSFCAPCLDEMPMLQRVLVDEKPKDLALAFVAVDGPATEGDARRVLAKRGLSLTSFLVDNSDPEPFILAADPSWSGQVPYTLFYAPDGTRLFAVDGEQSESELRAALDKARTMAAAITSGRPR